MIDELDDAAIQTDIYLEHLLASVLRPTVPRADEPVEPELADTAALLRRALVRFHPSFRFEERLLTRLRAEAGGQAAIASQVIAFPTPTPSGLAGAATTPTGDPADDLAGGQDRIGRGLLVGGAIASGVSLASIAGAVLVWRRTRGGPIAGRAV